MANSQRYPSEDDFRKAMVEAVRQGRLIVYLGTDGEYHGGSPSKRASFKPPIKRECTPEEVDELIRSGKY